MFTGSLFGTHDFFVFLCAAIALNLVPGQDTLYILGRSISQGQKAGIVSALGIGTGCLFHIIAAALGLYTVLALCPPLFLAITVLGGLYLVWLGLSPWLHRKRAGAGPGSSAALSAAIPADVSAASDRNVDLRVVYRQGLLTNLLNPKVALFFIAFLPAFIDPASGYGMISFIFLGLTFLVTGTIWCMVVALGASAFAGALRNQPRAQLWFDIFTSLLFVCLGAGIIFFQV